jgi:hypothetical protein
MTATTWIRFTGADKTILGELRVPKHPPTWFEASLKAGPEGRRDRTMSDITPSEWLDELFSRSLPIPLHFPLLSKLVEEDYYVPRPDLEVAEVKDEKGEVVNIDPSKIKTVLTGTELAEAIRHGKKLESFGELVPVPAQLLGIRAQQRIVHVPLLDPNQEKARTFKVLPNAFMLMVEQEEAEAIQRMAEGIYRSLEPNKVQATAKSLVF